MCQCQSAICYIVVNRGFDTKTHVNVYSYTHSHVYVNVYMNTHIHVNVYVLVSVRGVDE